MLNELEFIHKISLYLEGFKDLGNGKFNFRCNCCGDGSTGYKTRAWLIQRDTYFFHCFNCNAQMSFGNYLKLKFPEIYKEYVFDKLKGTKWEKGKSTLIFKEKSDIDLSAHNIVLSFLKPCTDYPEVVKYLEGRKTPSAKFSSIFVIENFKNMNYIDKYKDSKFLKELRIVFPIYNNKGIIIEVICRSISPTAKKRYINLKFYDEIGIFGLYDSKGDFKINLNKAIKICEGAFDSMFLDNAVSVNTADLMIFDKALNKKIINRLNIVYVPDNDTRNKEIVKIYKKIIEASKKIVILPDYIKGKDINEIVLNNPYIDINELLKINTFNGITALIKFNQWKKI